MGITRNAPFAVRYIRVFSAIALLLSIGSTVLLSMIAVYAWLGVSQLRIPFVVAGILNIISTTLILVFSLWQFSVLATVLAGGFPCFVIALATGGLWSVSVLQFRWLPDTVVVRDTKWILTAAIAAWVLKLALEVIFWTLLISLRYRRTTMQKEEILERHMNELEITETNDTRPTSSRSLAKPGEPRAPRQSILIAHAAKNWSRPFKPARAVTFPRHSPIPPERPPRSPPRQYPGLEPSPFSQSATNLSGTTSPFLNLLNRPKLQRAAATPSPLAATFPLSVAEREASKLAGFDEWDTSELPMQDRIAYSIAAAEATSPDPGAPPHARPSSTGTVTRTHRSSSMPTPPRTPPQQRPRTNSMGSGAPAAAQRQSVHIISPIPTSPVPKSTTPTIPPLKPFPISTTHLRQMHNMGLNIPLCDSPDREHHSVRLAASPLQTSTSARDFEMQNCSDSSIDYSTGNIPSRKSSTDHGASEGEVHTTDAWQTQWAATLERKVTPPMPGFEMSPAESMRRMREEREAQQSRQQQHATPQNANMLSTTSWIAEASSTESNTSEDFGIRARRSYAAPTTPNTGEFPRNVVDNMIEEIHEGLVIRR